MGQSVAQSAFSIPPTERRGETWTQAASGSTIEVRYPDGYRIEIIGQPTVAQTQG